LKFGELSGNLNKSSNEGSEKIEVKNLNKSDHFEETR